MKKTDFTFQRPSFLSGMARYFDFSGSLSATFPTEWDDARALEADWQSIGNDLRAAYDAYKKENKKHCDEE